MASGRAREALNEIEAALTGDPSNASFHNLRGLAYRRLGRHKEAEASFRKVIELSPRSAMGYNNLGILSSEQMKYEEAEELFRSALRYEPDSVTALLGVGSTLATRKDYASAVTYLEKACRINPADFQANYELAHVLRELKRPAEAQRVVKRMTLPRDPTLASKLFALSGVLCEDQGDLQAALPHYRRARELAPDSFDVYVTLVRAILALKAPGSDPSVPPAPADLSAEQHFTLGILFASGGASRHAVSHFKETLQMEPSSYAAAFNLALALRGAGDTPAAIEGAKRTLQMKPTAELYNLLGSLEESANDYLNAVAHFRKAVDLEPSSEQYYFDLGVEYLTHFTFGPALEAFEVGCRKFPTSSRQYVGKGLAHYSLRQYMEGAEALAGALEIDPSSPGSYAAWDALQSFLTPLDWERLLPRLRRLSELYPDRAEAKFCYGQGAVRLAQASHRSEYFELAHSMLKEVVRLKPAFADAFFELGNLYAARKENERAVEVLLEAIRLGPRSERAHYRLGQIYRDLNRLQLAEQELSRYSELVTNRHEQAVRNRSAIRQFVLAQPGVGPPPVGAAAKQAPPK